MGTALAVGVAAACAGFGGAPVASASAAKAKRCEQVKISGQLWGVYVDASLTPCATAGRVLAAVAEGRGKDVDKGPGVEYWLYEGWACPYNQMGETLCQHGSKPVAHASRVILALDCSTATGASGCPASAKLI